MVTDTATQGFGAVTGWYLMVGLFFENGDADGDEDGDGGRAYRA
jgi:hypothetical protein